MLTTHVLDTSSGKPAAGISIALARIVLGAPVALATAVTNDDGRTDAPLATQLDDGVYELTFAVETYFARTGVAAFYETIAIRFRVTAGGKYHVPLLLAPWGYSTYRGS